MKNQVQSLPPETEEGDFLIIEPGRTEKNYWVDIWRFRELFFILAWRDVSVRYKQTVVGVAWAVIRPFLTMIVFTSIFGGLAKLPSEGEAPYALMVFSALLPWQLFSSALSETSNSLIGNANLISKVYFPRLIIPFATIVTACIDFFVTLFLFFILMVWYGLFPGPAFFLFPFFFLLAVLASLGPGLWVTALNVKYRDFRYVIPFIVQFGLFISPVGFSSTVVPEKWRFLYSLNPMVGVIDGFRWSLLGGSIQFHFQGFFASVLVVFFFLGLGIFQFRKMERTFADMI